MKRTVYIIPILVIIFCLGMIFYNMSVEISELENSIADLKKSKIVKDDELGILALEYMSIEEELMDANKTIDNLSNDLTEKNSTIRDLECEIEHLVTRIESLSIIEEVNIFNKGYYAIISGFFKLMDYYVEEEYDKAYNLVSDSYYYDYRDDDLIRLYLKRIITNDDEIIIRKDEYNSNSFLLIDDDGNELYFSCYERNGNQYYYTIVQHAAEFDRKINAFVQGLKSGDIEQLTDELTEIDLKPENEDIVRVIDMYKEDFDLPTLEITFNRATQYGFEYILSGMKGNELHSELINVNIDDWSFISDYRGRYEWTGHNAPNEE